MSSLCFESTNVLLSSALSLIVFVIESFFLSLLYSPKNSKKLKCMFYFLFLTLGCDFSLELWSYIAFECASNHKLPFIDFFFIFHV